MYMGVRIEVFTMCNASQKYLHGRTESGESTIRTFDAKNKINCDPTPMYKMFCSCSNLYIYNIYVKHDTHLLASKKIFCTQICMKNYTALKLPSETLSGPTHNDMCFSIYLYYILTSRRPGTLAQRSVPKQKCQNLTSQT